MSQFSPLTVLGIGCVLVFVGGCRQPATELSPVVPETTTAPGDRAPETPATSPAPETVSSTPTPESTPAAAMQGTPIEPTKPAQLMAAQPEARINLRSQPTVKATAKGYGLVGDPVQLLRVAQGSDGYDWYYVKFEQSGAEGWIRGDFINIEGRAAPLPAQAVQSRTCEGLLESLVFTAYYNDDGFNLIRFENLESKNTFDSRLSFQGKNEQGQPVYTGSASPPTGGTYPVQLTDLSGGDPSSNTQVALNYSGLQATGNCQ